MERERFVQLVKVEQESLRRFLFAMCCGNGCDADDIAQETLMKAYLSLDKYKEKDRFGSWLIKIAHNTFLDHRRRNCPMNELDAAERLASMSAADGKFEYQELHLALDKLSPKERSVILLHYMQGYSIAEISEITDDSQSAIKKQLERGREHLKQKMKRR